MGRTQTPVQWNNTNQQIYNRNIHIPHEYMTDKSFSINTSLDIIPYSTVVSGITMIMHDEKKNEHAVITKKKIDNKDYYIYSIMYSPTNFYSYFNPLSFNI